MLLSFFFPFPLSPCAFETNLNTFACNLERLFSFSIIPWLRPLCHPPTPQWSLVISLRNSDMVPVLRKAQFKGPCGSLLLEQSQIVPIDSGESPPFSLTSPLNFMRPR